MKKGQFVKGEGHHKFNNRYGEVLKIRKNDCLIKWIEFSKTYCFWINKKYLKEIKKGELFK